MERRLCIQGAFTAFMCFLSAFLFSAQAQTWERGVSLGGFTNVNIYTPTTTSPVGPAGQKSLLLVLHGCVQPISAYDNANLEDAADAWGMVIAVPDAVNKQGFSCWGYWTGPKSRTADDYKRLIDLANAMSSDPARGIDPDQVYISGLSSGAAFANTTACLAPDVFAGVGASAGPSIGTSSNGALGPCETANVTARCNSYAGATYQPFLQTQIASLAQGDADTTVNQCYNTQNSDGMAGVYGVSQLPGSNTLSEGPGRTAQETLWENGRVSRLWFNGVDHAWSGGAGASGSYISGASINYASYLGSYFSTYNQRVDRNSAPVLSGLVLTEYTSGIDIAVTATDADGVIAAITAEISVASTGASVGVVTLSSTGGDGYGGVSNPLADELYLVTVSATDDAGAVSEPLSATVRIGPPPPPTAPSLTNVVVDVVSQCATVSGMVVDANEDLDTVVAAFANGSVTATLTGAMFSAEQCTLPGGANSVTVTASDLSGLSSSVTESFTIDAGQTATLDAHISAGRLDFTAYATCYLEYGGAAFTLRETSISANQCRWQDDDASCAGPSVACSTGGGSGGGGSGGGGSGGGGSGGASCEEFTTFNYYHKVAGRAYSTGNPFAPNYFAEGSNDAMNGSTWGSNTLSSDDGGTVWRLGSCSP